MIYDFFSLFYVMNSCEPDYKESAIVQEYWGVYTSLAFLVPPFLRIFLLGFRPLPKKLRRCYLSMIFVAFASSLFHSYVSYPTQAIDMTAILIAELCFAAALDFTISHYQEVFMVLSYFSLLITPILTSFAIALLFIQFSIVTIQKFKEIPDISLRFASMISLVSMILALLCIPLDLICNSPLLYHAYWHILIAVYCFSGAISIELLNNLKILKAE